MKKSNESVQYENALTLAIAIACGYRPVDTKTYKKELAKRIKDSGISNYKEAYNYAYSQMPQYVGEDAIFAGKLSLSDDKHNFIDLSLGNVEDEVDEYNNVKLRVVSEFLTKNGIKGYDAHDIIRDKNSMYDFLEERVLPKLLDDRLRILARVESKNNVLEDMEESKALDTLFDLKFKAFTALEKCRGNRDKEYYSLAHGQLDAVIDLYHSVLHAYDFEDIDTRAISPRVKKQDKNNILDELEK